MKFLLVKILHSRIIAFGIFLNLIFGLNILAQDIPPRPDPPRLVNDFVGLFTAQQAAALENKLVAFDDSTSTQIAVVVVKDLGGYDASQYAFTLSEKWGVGQKGKNNGVVILIKPKTESSSGKAFIATGYGVEGALPDALCKRIVDNEMIPYFRQSDYYGGVDAAINTIISLTKGEFTANQYLKKKTGGNGGIGGLILFVVILIVIIAIISGNRGSRNHDSIGRRNNIPFWMLMGGLGSGRSGGGSWGGFSGGGGGGFGGFGGGSFGGGGAGGSW